MRQILNFILKYRAKRLAHRLRPYLSPAGWGLDIGSGTGHTVQALGQHSELTFVEADVVDLSVVGPGPVLFQDETLPYRDNTFACSLITFVLQYPADPHYLLLEASRVTSGRVLVIQSTYRGWWGYTILRLNEFMWGPVAFQLARRLGLIDRSRFSLGARRLLNRQELRALFDKAGLDVLAWQAQPWPGLPVSYDLFILEKNRLETI